MLARVIESFGIPTVTVTMIPELALKMHASRVVGVEFPFGHSFGNPWNDELMLKVSRAAGEALSEAGAPGYRLDVDAEWPVPLEIAYKSWHPPQASPIVARMLKARQNQ